jgi:threonine/homoserine/homoserine lactone efflux protein
MAAIALQDQVWKNSQKYSVISGVAAFIVSKKIINLGLLSSLALACGATYLMWNATKAKRDETNPGNDNANPFGEGLTI